MSTLLQINKISKNFGGKEIFDEASFTVSAKEKVAVVGRNGAGKSTLFKMIIGEEEYSSGEINIFPSTIIAYLKQDNPFKLNETVLNFLMRTSQKADWECAKMAGFFQIKGDDLEKNIGEFAGGYQMRIKLIAMLLKSPNLLLLDEPTNYLDLSTQLLLEKFLKNYKGAFLLISHDREFIKKTCDQTAEIEHGKITKFPQPLEEYLEYKETQIEAKLSYNKKIEREKKHLQKFVDKFRAKASKASQAQSKMKQIQKLKTIEVLHPLSSSKIKLPEIENKKGIALEVKDMSIGYADKVVAKDISLEIERGENIAILGDNGQGKSTFLKTIAGQLKALKGEYKWGHKIKIGYYAQHVLEDLRSKENVKSYLEGAAPLGVSDEDIYEMAANFLFKNEDLKKEVRILSGGEKARLCLAGLLLQKNEVLMMDEPTNHLDFETVEALASALKSTATTVIFVSHNRTFVDILASGIVEVENGKVKRYQHNYEEYVYHLNLKIDADLNEDSQTKSSTNEKTSSHKEKRLKLKELRKKLRKVEKELEKVVKERQELLKWFEENYTKFSKEKNERLDLLNKNHQQLEDHWMSLELEIEVIES